NCAPPTNNSDLTTPSSSTPIVVADSHPEALHAIRATPRDQGYVQLTLADSAQKALRILRRQAVELLIVDVDTRDLDGWRLSRLVRSGILHCRPDIPILIITSTWCERIAEVTAREYGINALLPMEHMNRLPQVVESLLHATQTQVH